LNRVARDQVNQCFCGKCDRRITAASDQSNPDCRVAEN
jgi:hypothetical protein